MEEEGIMEHNVALTQLELEEAQIEIETLTEEIVQLKERIEELKKEMAKCKEIIRMSGPSEGCVV